MWSYLKNFLFAVDLVVPTLLPLTEQCAATKSREAVIQPEDYQNRLVTMNVYSTSALW